MQKAARRASTSAVAAIALIGSHAFAQQHPSPVRMDPERMAGFTGEELRASIFASTPATTDHSDRPLEYDEFVLVLNGKLILTEQSGRAQAFTPGDVVILPKGYTGTWEMQGDYRELAVVPVTPGEITAEGGSPVRMDPDLMAGLGLTPIPNDGFIDILVEGELEFTIGDLFSGENFRAVVVESTPAKTDHRNRPLEYDEFVLVLNGGLVLTEQNGRRQEFWPGDALVVPKGYTGTWEQLGTYRELALILAGD
jgi:uncharacterized cupin superfamily protein